MAGKKRKKSNTERINYEKRRAQRQDEMAKARKKKLILAIVVAALIVGAIVGIIFGSIAIAEAIKDANRDPSDDYSVYYVSGAGKEYAKNHDIAYADIVIEDYGTITVLLDKTAAPKTVENFIKLAEEGFYDGLTFHRIVEGFMIQGGDPSHDGTGGKLDENGNKVTITGEFSANGVYSNGYSHKRGVISMARGQSNNSASSQFFICNADAPSLDGKYAAFGYVIDGLIIVDKITEDYAGRTDRSEDNEQAGTKGGVIEKVSRQPVIESITIRYPSKAELGGDNELEEDLINP